MPSSAKHNYFEGWLAYAQVFVAALSVSVAAFFLDRNDEHAHELDLRLKMAAALSQTAETLGERLHFEIASISAAAKGIGDQPDIGADKFRALAETLMQNNPDLLFVCARTVSGATLEAGRNGFKRNVADNHAGASPRQDYMAGASRGAVAASFGPIAHLRSGENILKVSVPVLAAKGDSVLHWGTVTGYIDARKFFRKTGALPVAGARRMAIRISGQPEDALAPYFSIQDVRSAFDGSAVRTSLNVLSETWQLAATPLNGWHRTAVQTWTTRGILFFIGAIVLFPFFRSLRLQRLNVENQVALSRRELLLQRLTKRLDLALGSYRCGVWEASPISNEAYWDERMLDLHGITGHGGSITSEAWQNLVHPDDRERILASLPELHTKSEHLSLTTRILRPDGDVRHIRYVAQMHEDQNGERKLFGIAVDVTEDVVLAEELRLAKQETEAKNAELQEVSRRYQLAVQAYGCAVWEADIETGMAVWDRRLHDFFGIPYEDGLVDGKYFLQSIHPEDLARVTEAIDHAVHNGTHYSCNYRIITRNAGIRHLQAMGQVHHSAGGKPRFIGIALDVTDQIHKNEALIAAKNDAEAKRAELEAMHARLQHHATHDPLTGLKNRRALDEVLEQLAAEPQNPLKRVTLLHIDLDRFKQINDTLGHAAGDAMLAHAADVLRRNTAEGDLVARIGGDEFVVLLQNNANNREIGERARLIIEEMNVPMDYKGQECRFGVSIGIAREQTRRRSVKQLLVNADIALYRAKAHGRNRFEFFTSNLQAEIRRNKTLADEILRGLENREFIAWYQPQFCAKTHDLTGVEALVRWNHPERGLLTPDQFLKNAEEINALATIDAQMLEQAFADRLTWAAEGLLVPKISVNVSARRLRDDQLLRSLKDLAIAPGQVAFELVESIYLDDDDEVITRNIRRLKSLGIDIEIDDFGTGHTSIVSLLKLEPKRLKIDRQLVQPMLTASRQFSLVRSIIDIGTSLDIETVAEGVETMMHAIRLKELGCSTLQGYAFAKPRPAAELVPLIQACPWKTVPEPPFFATAI